MFSCCTSQNGYFIFINQDNKRHTIDDWKSLTDEERNFFALAEQAYSKRNKLTFVNAYITFMNAMKNERDLINKYPDYNSIYLNRDQEVSLDTFSRIWSNLNKEDRQNFYNEANHLKKLFKGNLV
jgi:hypothetical protein